MVILAPDSRSQPRVHTHPAKSPQSIPLRPHRAVAAPTKQTSSFLNLVAAPPAFIVRGFRPAVFPIAAAPFAQKRLSINLHTHVRDEHDHVEVSQFNAKLPLRSSIAASRH